jgi:hypothetical protein
LSRLFSEEELEKVNKQEQTSEEEIYAITGLDHRSELKLYQREDKFFGPIINKIENQEFIPHTYMLIDGLLYYKDRPPKRRLCIPQKLVSKILENYHGDEPYSGHLGTRKTVQRIARSFF